MRAGDAVESVADVSRERIAVFVMIGFWVDFVFSNASR